MRWNCPFPISCAWMGAIIKMSIELIGHCPFRLFLKANNTNTTQNTNTSLQHLALSSVDHILYEIVPNFYRQMFMSLRSKCNDIHLSSATTNQFWQVDSSLWNLNFWRATQLMLMREKQWHNQESAYLRKDSIKWVETDICWQRQSHILKTNWLFVVLQNPLQGKH